MYVSDSKIKEARKIFKDHEGIMRTSEAGERPVFHERTLYHMRDVGILNRMDRGLYHLAEGDPISNPDLVLVAKKVSEARICLISALAIHDLTDEIPHAVHIALPHASWEPKMEYPPLKVYRFSDETLKAGVQIHEIDGVEIKVFEPAKTIADCFEFRNQIGQDPAIEALKRGISQKKATYKDIIRYARLCNVERVIQPYLEALGHG
ncbi:MAG: hypothetical protein U5J95_05390 [Balneolaceae bacterium]|nr:hypothetical protein [Balneolaceae bacterium]